MASKLTPFLFPTLPSTWFIGHMSRALREMESLLQSHSIDLIIETRDARLPLTSHNPTFEDILNRISGSKRADIDTAMEGRGAGGAKRLIVYNKRDLAQECFMEPLKKALQKQGRDPVIFTDSSNDQDVKLLLKTALRSSARSLPPPPPPSSSSSLTRPSFTELANRPLLGPEDRIQLLVAGMPNVGKSSLLNALRRVGVQKGKAASVSPTPGHTRRLSTVIKISLDPPAYVYDTPGIMVPFLGKGIKGQETAVKLALTGGIKESLFEGETVAEYLIWRLGRKCEEEGEGSVERLEEVLGMTMTIEGKGEREEDGRGGLDDPQGFLKRLAKRLSAMKKGGEPDVDFAGRWLIRFFREGRLGPWTLDGLGRGGEVVDCVEYAGEKMMEVKEGEEEGGALEKGVEESVAEYFEDLRRKEELGVGKSGHQEKKDTKAKQALVRVVKRKEKEVAKVDAALKGPKAMALVSARRRKFRRNA